MATLNFNMTIADADVPASAAAIKTYLGNPSMTDAQAIEGLRQEFISRFKDIVSSTRKAAAVVAADAANYTPNVT
jgi:molybdopterin-biosynthesis enzyme MoeA-like protein